MSQMVNEQLERRLVEHLDGELSEPQRVDLYRELLRDQKLRRRLDEYTEIDRIAGEALRALIDAPRRPVAFEPPVKRRVPWAQIMATAAVFIAAVSTWGLVQAVMPLFNSTDTVAQQPDQPEQDPSSAAADGGRERKPADDKISRDGGGAELAGGAMAGGAMAGGAMTAGMTGAEPAGDYWTDIPAEAQADPWWRKRPAAIDNGQLVDTAAAEPIIDGAQHGRRSHDRSLIGVLDEDADRFYWFEVDNQQTVVESVSGEL